MQWSFFVWGRFQIFLITCLKLNSVIGWAQKPFSSLSTFICRRCNLLSYWWMYDLRQLNDRGCLAETSEIKFDSGVGIGEALEISGTQIHFECILRIRNFYHPFLSSNVRSRLEWVFHYARQAMEGLPLVEEMLFHCLNCFSTLPNFVNL